MVVPVCLFDGLNPLCLDDFLDFSLFSCWTFEEKPVTTAVDIVPTTEQSTVNQNFEKKGTDCYGNSLHMRNSEASWSRCCF